MHVTAFLATTEGKRHHHIVDKHDDSIWAYLAVSFVQTNVYSVSNSTAGVGCPIVRRPQLLSSPHSHKPGKTRLPVMHLGT